MSMLRNVLTYMGLGPDEDYEDSYLYDSAHADIDLTDSADEATAEAGPADEPPAAPASDQRRLTDGGNGLDPHAQRRRPDWLSPPAPTPDDARPEFGRRKISIDDEDPDLVRSPRGRHDFDPRESAPPLRAVPPAMTDQADDGVTVRSVPTETVPEPPAPEQAAEPEPRNEGIRFVKPRALSPQSFGDAKTLADEFKAQVPVIMNLQDIERDLARRLIDFASGICYALDGSMEKIASQVFLLTPQEVEVSDEDRRRMEQRGYDS
ncbi:MAG: cell division protein SepF [Acidimicrobiia bacterium]|nr:cell division protein SepF [Acidimicrobiia bacterium]